MGSQVQGPARPPSPAGFLVPSLRATSGSLLLPYEARSQEKEWLGAWLEKGRTSFVHRPGPGNYVFLKALSSPKGKEATHRVP